MGGTYVDLRKVFLGLQGQMIEKMQVHGCLTHAPTIGAAHERGFIELLETYLPKRYRVGQGFILDCEGNCSQQIDIVIYDRQYSPFLFCQDGTFFIPAESVYAVMEVKPELKKSTVQYAGSKIASVRKLRRTSATIRYAGQMVPGRRPFQILGVILTVRSIWAPAFGKEFEGTAMEMGEQGRIDVGCALTAGSADVWYEGQDVRVERGDAESALIFFFLHLLARLQELGTVPAMDIREYAKKVVNSE
jgi:hypothetical protein